MTMRHGTWLAQVTAGVGVTSPLEARLAIAGTLVKDTTGKARAGIFYEGNASLITGTAGMAYSVARFNAAQVRSVTDGATLFCNDGTVSVATIAAPGANSRIDIIYTWARDFGLDGTNSDPVLLCANGAPAAGTPPDPVLPTGAIEIGRATVSSGATATNGGAVVISQTCQFTAMAGGAIAFRTAPERNLFTNASLGQKAFVLADLITSTWTGAAWASASPVSATGGASIGTTEVVVPSCSLTLAPGNWDVIASAYMDWSTSGGSTPVHVLRLRSGGVAGTEVDQKRININGHVGQVPASLQAQLVLTVSTVVVLTGVSTGPAAGTTLVQNARIRATPTV